MSEWLRFSIAFWHSMRSLGSDPFGVATRNWPWEHGPEGEEPLRVAERRMEAFFELAQKLGFKYWCFHDRLVVRGCGGVVVLVVGGLWCECWTME